MHKYVETSAESKDTNATMLAALSGTWMRMGDWVQHSLCSKVKLLQVSPLRPGLVRLHHDAWGGAPDGRHEGLAVGARTLDARHNRLGVRSQPTLDGCAASRPAQLCKGVGASLQLRGWDRGPSTGLARARVTPWDGPPDVLNGDARVALGAYESPIGVKGDRGVGDIWVRGAVGAWRRPLACEARRGDLVSRAHTLHRSSRPVSSLSNNVMWRNGAALYQG